MCGGDSSSELETFNLEQIRFTPLLIGVRTAAQNVSPASVGSIVHACSSWKKLLHKRELSLKERVKAHEHANYKWYAHLWKAQTLWRAGCRCACRNLCTGGGSGTGTPPGALFSDGAGAPAEASFATAAATAASSAM